MKAFLLEPFRLVVFLASASLALVGCTKEPAVQDAGAAREVVDAGPPAPPPTILEVAVSAELSDGGLVEIPAPPDGEKTLIPQVQALRVATNLGLSNYRIRVFDEADRALASDDEATTTPEGIRYRISLGEPLKTGYAYAVMVDAQTGPELLDTQGRPQRDARIELKVDGERVKPPPPPKKKSSRKKRRR